MEELKVHLDYGKAIIYVSVFSIFVTALTHFIFKKYRYIKYLPGLILVLIGFFNLFTIKDLTSSQSINNLILMIIGFGGGLASILAALIIGIFTKPVKIKNKTTEDK